MIIAGAILAAFVLGFVEWRRRDTRHRVPRVAATCIAVAALTWWGREAQADSIEPPKDAATGVLWTPGGSPGAPPVSSESLQFTLPGAGAHGGHFVKIPDVSYLRRHHRGIDRLHLVGGGLEPFELNALRDVKLSFDASNTPPHAPSIAFLHTRRRIAVGDPVAISGRVRGLREGERARVVVEGPGGSSTDAVLTGDSFAVESPAIAAAGRFIWTIKLIRDDEQGSVVAQERIGIAVVPPSWPRVLVLESSPNLETTHLQRWFSENGGTFAARTLVGAGRNRFDGEKFSQVDAALLAKFDLLIADVRTLISLPAHEAEAIDHAVAGGLGLLVLPRGEATGEHRLAPWKIEPASADAENATRTARLQWPGLAAPMELPVAVENVGVDATTSETPIVTDSRGFAVVRAVSRGRGEIALSLVRDSWRWRVQNQSAAFAQYWSPLLSRLAKRPAANSWSLGNTPEAPLVVHQPVELAYTCDGEAPPPAETSFEADSQQVRLPLAQHPVEAGRWQGTFWPRRPGWHRVTAPDSGAHLDFFVHEQREWESLRAEHRRLVTERFVARQQQAEQATPAPTTPRLASSGNTAIAAFIAFLLSSGYLWLERRRLR